MKKHAALFALFLFACCAPKSPPVEPPTVIVSADAGSPCDRACGVLSAFSCPEALPSPGGVTCVAVCTNAGIMLDAQCVAAAENRADLLMCGVRCEQ